MIDKGHPAPLGASCDADGTNFAIYSSAAASVELCFFDAQLRESGRHALTEATDGVWHGYVHGCKPGQAYGYRVHGRYLPQQGLRYNPQKLLIDPYARKLCGEFSWSPAVFDFETPVKADSMQPSELDSADFVPKCVVVGHEPAGPPARPKVPWPEMIIYEANVRGYTMHHPEIGEADRGRFRGMQNAVILDYLKSLGITSIELMPVHAFIDEHHLYRRGLRNLWGYNSINFFTPAARYLGDDDIHAFRDMVNAIHDAGIEVILDVAFNHTGEGDRLGPTLSFRGIDNLTYYRTVANNPGDYVNDTGCGNTLDTNHPVVRDLILDSLRYWANTMGVDGFRFDLATVLGRNEHGFSPDHPMLTAIGEDPALRDIKLIAEPWDPGPGGYQLGKFPPRWAEWNDRYRDCVRQFWRGDSAAAAEFARRLHGSSDLFEVGGRKPSSSINFVTSHDGFTLADVVSFARRHNEANGERNRDGHAENYSHNHGTEGATDDSGIIAIRRRQRLNMLATLLLSQGTPMILAGDELGNSQGGNNNAYAQDNAIGWVDWTGARADPEFLELLRSLIRLRRDNPLLRQSEYVHDQTGSEAHNGISWLHPDGTHIAETDWPHVRAISLVLSTKDESDSTGHHGVAVVINGSDTALDFRIPGNGFAQSWQVAFTSGGESTRAMGGIQWRIDKLSVACLLQNGVAGN